jgi:hypothetical protein
MSEETTEPKDQDLWELRWAEVKDMPDNDRERMKRYGLAYSMDENADRYCLRFALPKKVPNHKMKFKWGLPDRMPDYKIDVGLDGKILRIKAVLEDEKVRKLCDVANSFPDRFLRELELPLAGKSITHNYDSADKVLEIVVEKNPHPKKSDGGFYSYL